MAAAERVVDPYGLVCKAEVWYLVPIPAARHACSGCRGSRRRQVETRPAPVPVVVRVRREWLDMFGRICAAHYPGIRVGTG